MENEIILVGLLRFPNFENTKKPKKQTGAFLLYENKRATKFKKEFCSF